MADKTSELNQLGNSEIPSDLLTPTLGSSYGLGEYPDMEYGMGVLEGVPAEEAPTLPTGLARGAAEDLDITSLVASEELADLNWLDPTQLQDPERLPKSPHGEVIPELEEAWGVHRRTNGLQVITRDLKQAQYEESLAKGSSVPEKKATARQMIKVVAHAMRRSAAGQDIDTITREALKSMGEEMGRVAGALRKVRAEHGLAGNVFIRAAAYPGYGTGRWSKHVRKHASRARYVIVTAKEMEQATWINEGRCAYTGKVAVTQIPWKEALAHYTPRLESAGRKVASSTPEALRLAFLRPAAKNISETWLPRHTAPSQRVSAEEAREAMAAYMPERKVYRPTDGREEKLSAGAKAQVKRWGRDGLISESACSRILAADVSPERRIQTAVALIKKADSRGYSGAKNSGVTSAQVEAALHRDTQRSAAQKARLEAHRDRLAAEEAARQAAWVADKDRALAQGAAWLQKNAFSGAPNQGQAGDIKAREARRADDQARVAKHQAGLDRIAEERREAEAKAAARKVAKVISSGLRGRKLVAEIKRLVPRELVPRAAKYIDPLIRRHNALEEPKGPGAYEGTQFTRATPKQASQNERAGTVRAALQYVRRTMSEGFAGDQLDSLIASRFSSKVLAAMGDSLTELREAHEGGAGFLYVDASAYASPRGVTGCEAGGLKHRANRIPAVTQMDRCGSCTLAHTLPDGTKKCSVYNKVLLEDTTGPEMDRMRAANVRVARMSEAEQTASIFAPAYDPSEFGLRNSNLENVSPEFPEHEKVADIVFGGWDLG